MSAKPSAGPWKAERLSCTCCWTVYNEAHAIAKVSGAAERLRYPSEEENEANAKLIAAAPTMAEVLDSLLETVGKNGELSRLGEYSIVEVREMAVSALRAAGVPK